jgi:hypothetical protein
MRTITRRTALRRKSIFWCFCCLEKYTKGKETRAGIQCGISRKTKSLEHAGVTDNVYIFSRPLGWTEPGPNGSVYSILDSSLLMSLFLALPAAPAREAVWYTRQSLVVLRSSADQSRPEQTRAEQTRADLARLAKEASKDKRDALGGVLCVLASLAGHGLRRDGNVELQGPRSFSQLSRTSSNHQRDYCY